MAETDKKLGRNSMRNKLGILIVVALLANIVWAAVEVTITIPDQHVATVIDALKTLAGTHMTIESRGHDPNPADDFDGRWDFRIDPKDPNETNKEFGERFNREIIRACVRVVKSYEENQRYRDDVAAVTPPDVNTPDEVVE